MFITSIVLTMMISMLNRNNVLNMGGLCNYRSRLLILR